MLPVLATILHTALVVEEIFPGMIVKRFGCTVVHLRYINASFYSILLPVLFLVCS